MRTILLSVLALLVVACTVIAPPGPPVPLAAAPVAFSMDAAGSLATTAGEAERAADCPCRCSAPPAGSKRAGH